MRQGGIISPLVAAPSASSDTPGRAFPRNPGLTVPELNSGAASRLDWDALRALLRGLDKCRDRSSAVGQPPIGAIGMDLIALLFGFFKARGEDDAAARGVRFHRVRKCGCVWEAENGLEHLDDVFKRVLVVIQDDHVVELAQLVFCRLIDICI